MPSGAYNRFLKQLIILSAIVGLISLIAGFLMPRISPATPFLLLLIMSITMLVHRSLLRSYSGKPNRFINRFLALTTLKLLGYLAVITAYALINRPDAVPFIVTFLIYYVIYSAFEVSALLKYLKNPA